MPPWLMRALWFITLALLLPLVWGWLVYWLVDWLWPEPRTPPEPNEPVPPTPTPFDYQI